MNKYIALAFFALCAAVANCHIITPGGPYGLYSTDIINSGSGSASSAAAAASSASSANNAALQGRLGNPWISSPLGVYGPYGGAGPYGPYGPVAGPWPGLVQVL